MEKLYELIDKLKKELDNDLEIKEIKYLLPKLLNDEKFMKKIRLCQENYTKENKEALFFNEDFRRYKLLENNLNLKILQINKELKKITNEESKCSK